MEYRDAAPDGYRDRASDCNASVMIVQYNFNFRQDGGRMVVQVDFPSSSSSLIVI